MRQFPLKITAEFIVSVEKLFDENQWVSGRSYVGIVRSSEYYAC